jgi:ubiquinone/menaquinone biosynthesis C-methylase UbiE
MRAEEFQKMIDYNKISEDYVQHRQHVHPEVLNALLSAQNEGTPSTVLEVGCGTANYIIAIESLTGSSCWGIDPSEKMLSVARERSSKITFQLGKAEQLDFAANFFDLIFSVDVIHHVTGHLDYFREAYRVLKPGGHICTATDSEWVLRNRRPLATHFPETVETELARYPRIPKLAELMTQVGFGAIKDTLVEFSFQLKDIQAYRDRAFSSLHLISEDAYQRGIHRLEDELREQGFIRCISRYTLLWGTKPA